MTMTFALQVLPWLAMAPLSGDDAPTMNSNNSPASARRECVFMVHGLGRTKLSLRWLGHEFEAQGYRVVHLSYRSTRQGIWSSAEELQAQLAKKLTGDEERVHFVTHSLGGIVIRACLQKHRPANLGRVVMLGPPNQGSEVVDRLSGNPIYRLATGPAGQELGTAATSTPNQLGPVDYEVGIIAGSRSGNPLFSSWIREECDGKVSVKRAGLEGMRDLVVVRSSHTFMMRSREVAAQALHFIARGEFSRSTK
ncbi:MAG TPA: alpha/beta fold hydrolase [Verrucomicrobiae bacterium]|nr:alpha/beta fold hydrolase [Verrucomicrobiae bacterium]